MGGGPDACVVPVDQAPVVVERWIRDRHRPRRRGCAQPWPRSLARPSLDWTPMPTNRQGDLAPLVVIGGPTATGKTGLAIALAERLIGAGPPRRDHLGRLPAGVPRPGHRHREGHARGAGARRPPRPRPRRPRRAVQRGRVPGPRARRSSPTSAAAAASGSSPAVRGSGCAPSHGGLDTDALPSDAALRATLEAELTRDGVDALAARLRATAPSLAARTDHRNPRRVVRALEIATLQGDEPLPPALGYPAPIASACPGCQRPCRARTPDRACELAASSTPA